jgi:predicted aspartyl protease
MERILWLPTAIVVIIGIVAVLDWWRRRRKRQAGAARGSSMGRVVVPIHIRNPLHPEKSVLFDALVDTGAVGLVLPHTWRDRLTPFAKSRKVKLETADQRIVDGEICGPVEVQIEGFDPVFNEVTFLVAEPQDGVYEPLLGYVLLEQSGAAVDLVGHRLVHVKHFDLKLTRAHAA